MGTPIGLGEGNRVKTVEGIIWRELFGQKFPCFMLNYKEGCWQVCVVGRLHRPQYLGCFDGRRSASQNCKRLRWSRGTQIRGFAPGRSRRIFRAKVLSTPSFGGEVKPSVPCRSFTACKRSLNVTWNSAFRQNYRTFLTHSSTFRRWVLSRGDTHGDAWWRKL